jgi:hypothetical protein
VLRETPRLLRQPNELDQVLDFLERMNLHDVTDVPTTVTDMLHASGLRDTRNLSQRF